MLKDRGLTRFGNMMQRTHSSRTKLLFLLLASILLWGCTPEGQETTLPERKPNIVIIFADDLGYGDLGAYGHPTIKTPNLDKMASEGLKFTQFYVGASVCTPSRAALLTGRLPIRYGMVSDKIRVLFPFSYGGLPKEEITIAEALKTQDYATAIVGKWHLGHLPEHLPLHHGFDYYFGIPYSNDMRRDTTTRWKPAQKYEDLYLIEDSTIIERDVDQRLLTKRYTEKAKQFIKSNKDNPFFLYVPYNFTHVPLYASTDFENKSTAGIYGDVVEELDWSVGQILETLAAENIAENTLVIFTSDNGPWLVKGNEGGSAGLLREGKGSTWEGGMREPAIAWWPGTIEGGRTTQAISTTMDLYATALKLAGVDNPADRILDGADLTPVLLGTTEQINNEVFYYLGEQLFAVRQGSWKMHLKTLTPYVGESPVDHDPPLLFNLDLDPSEKRNVAADHPEVIHQLITLAEEHLAGVEKIPSILNDIDESYFE